ncbi:pyruvate dehydrogenase [Streptomyces sp. NPDC059637]|uniref:transketolase-like TK C-terminal-containing protein n=1 Tax=Streptomyces sp. NPDC059637 TaxID=3347752 RepID=UPI0036CC00EF
MTTLWAPAAPDAVPRSADAPSEELLRSIQQRVLWLSTAIVHHANRVRPNPSGLKVGGHQASSASMASIMTALWFGDLTSADRVSVKPHASPVLHAINYLLGGLDEKYLTTLREFGGLQSYPSRTKDPDRVDYSTGSVGIGATAPIWGATARRYLDAHAGALGAPAEPRGRQISLVGDAELDEGACWEALLDPGTAGLGEVMWVVDLNRQSLDRVVPVQTAQRYERMFHAAGWQVVTLKYGRRLGELFTLPGGDALRHRLDTMSNAEYQRLLRADGPRLRERLPGTGTAAGEVRRLIGELDDVRLREAVRDLGGHDLSALLSAYRAAEPGRPTVVLAYTLKGFGLPTEGHPANHSALLSTEDVHALAASCGIDPQHPWQRFAEGSAEAEWCARTAGRLARPEPAAVAAPAPPADFGRPHNGRSSTQQALGRLLLDLTRSAPEVARRVVTVSPDVASSTNLGGWLNKVGVWSEEERTDWFADDAETVLHWREGRQGQHLELGIAETNLVGLLGELGATWSRWGQPLLPIGVLYDPFVNRALEPWTYGVYAGGQSILVGTPSGVTLAGEGGAHQSVTTPSIGLEQPGVLAYEPAFSQDFEWCFLHALSRLGRPDGTSSYFRLSTRPVDQRLARVPQDPREREERRRQAVAGGYVLREADDAAVTIAAMGAVVPEALAAADSLEAAHGIRARVVCVTSADLLYRALQDRRRAGASPAGTDGTDGTDGSGGAGRPDILAEILPPERAVPMVTVLDGHPHTLTFLATVDRVPVVSLGVSGFGQSGSLEDVLSHHGIDAAAIAAAAAGLAGR